MARDSEFRRLMARGFECLCTDQGPLQALKGERFCLYHLAKQLVALSERNDDYIFAIKIIDPEPLDIPLAH